MRNWKCSVKVMVTHNVEVSAETYEDAKEKAEIAVGEGQGAAEDTSWDCECLEAEDVGEDELSDVDDLDFDDHYSDSDLERK